MEVETHAPGSTLPSFLLLLLLLRPPAPRRAARIEVFPKKLKIYGLDHPQRLTAKLLDKRGRPLEIGTANWESSKPEVAAVDVGGLVTPKSEGKTRIIARYDTVTAEVPVEVIDVKGIDVQPASMRVVGPSGTSTSPPGRRQELEEPARRPARDLVVGDACRGHGRAGRRRGVRRAGDVHDGGEGRRHAGARQRSKSTSRTSRGSRFARSQRSFASATRSSSR